ncbi:MAG: alpha/beta fold hydrolase [Gemmatirosa sp.]
MAGGIATLAAVPAGWMAYSALFVDHAVPLPPAIDAERRVVRGARSGVLSMYADARGTGVPLVLLHSVNAAASAYEVRPLFERYRGQRPVYAPDLPGFGFSERGDRAYTPELYVDAIDDVLAAAGDGAPCDVVALSLAGEFAARVAARAPERVRSLVLVSPTGLSLPTQRRGGQRRGADGAAGLAQRVLSAPLVGQPLFDALVSRPSIRFFLGRSFAGPPDPGLVDYAYQTAHQPGARFAPFAFLSGRLFTPDVRERFYEAVAAPALVLHDDAPYSTFGALPQLVARRPNWRGLRIGPTRGLPHFERPDAFAAALEALWTDAG